jgi:hypothetical protein
VQEKEAELDPIQLDEFYFEKKSNRNINRYG